MSWRGMLRKGGMETNGYDLDVFQGNITARNLIAPVGNVYYVDLSVASSGTGRSWAQAYKTLAEAITVVRDRIDWGGTPWGTRDIIVIAPGTYIENLTALPHGALMIGLGWDNRDAQYGVKIKPASGLPVNVGGAMNIGFIGISFESADTSKAFYSGVFNNCYMERCRFSGAAESVTCTHAFQVNDAVANKWYDCDFTCAAVGFDAAYADGGDSFSHNHMKNCRFSQHTTAALRTTLNLVGPSSLIEDCVMFGGGQTLAIGVDDNSGILELVGLKITATDPIQGCRAANACYGNGVILDGTGE